MINKISENFLEIFEQCRTTMKKASWDKENKEYMVKSELEVINFDNLKSKYCKMMKLNGEGIKSNDVLFIKNDKFVFIEFKNGKNIKRYDLQQKNYDSILIFNDIFNKTLKDTRIEMDYIMVYNSKYNEKLGGQFLGKMKIVTEKLGLEKFEKYFFNKVHTYSKEEFEEKFVKKIEKRM